MISCDRVIKKTREKKHALYVPHHLTNSTERRLRASQALPLHFVRLARDELVPLALQGVRSTPPLACRAVAQLAIGIRKENDKRERERDRDSTDLLSKRNNSCCRSVVDHHPQRISLAHRLKKKKKKKLVKRKVDRKTK